MAAATDDHLKALGRLVNTFANLETSFAFCTWGLISKDQGVGQQITPEMSFRNLVNAFASLYRYRAGQANKLDAKRSSQLKTIINRALEAEVRRNQLIHSLYISSDIPEAVTRFKMTAKGQHKVQTEDLTADQINIIVDEIQTVTKDLMEFVLPDAIQVHQP